MPAIQHVARTSAEPSEIAKPTDPDALILESWSQGYMVGSLIVMGALTVANMRRGVRLHKLILFELILGTFMGTFMFAKPPAYGWYLSATAVPLNTSWWLHNVIAWIKIKPFLSKKWSLVFIISVFASIPYWVVEIYANFTYFNGINQIFLKTRPYESIFRDPWWIFTTVYLFYQIATQYRIKLTSLVVISPRFGVLLVSMILSICFIILDVLSVTHVFGSALPDGLNPFWKLSTVFKCLTDSIILDDFKTALDRLMRHKMSRDGFTEERGIDNGNVGSSRIQPSMASPNAYSNAFSSWGSASDREAAKFEDPLGEESMERRVTHDTVQKACIQSDFDRAKARASCRPAAASDELERELAACGTPSTASRGDMAHSSHQTTKYDELYLPSMLTEPKSNKG